MVLKRIGVLSLGKMMGAVYAVLGVLVGALFAVIGMLGASLGDSGSALPGAGLGIVAIIVFPLLYGAMGFIGGVITAALYNVAAGLIGGIELELQ